MSERPLIGISGPDGGGITAWLMTAFAIRRAGGRPVRITASRPFNEALLDGMVIGGGTDVDPLHYGEEPATEEDKEHYSLLDWLVTLLLFLPRILLARHSKSDYDIDRDQLEQKLIRHALYERKPLLGICRGAQILNVTLGGSLHQNIEHYYSEDTGNVRSVLPRKTIETEPDSRLAAILGAGKCRVNALHEQSIKHLGDDVFVCAREPSGVVQAIEKRNEKFVIGVQWHPEYMPQHQRQLELFRQLVSSAATSSDSDQA